MVHDSGDQPIAGANVLLNELRRSAFADEYGTARIKDVRPGLLRFKIVSLTYIPIEDSVVIRAGAVETRRFSMRVDSASIFLKELDLPVERRRRP
jgi:hypothetical protein